jgi:PAS domain S-box-containing protein
MKELIFVANHEGTILFINSEGGAFHEFNQSNLFFANIYELFTPESNLSIKEKIRKSKEGKVTSVPSFDVILAINEKCQKANLKLELIYCPKGDLSTIAGSVSCIGTVDHSSLFYKQFYMAFIDNLPLGVYRSGANGIIHYASKKFVEILGFESAEEVYQINVNDLFVTEGLREKMFKDWAERPMEPYEVQLYKKNGEVIWVKDSGRIIKNEDDEIVFLDGILEDITLQKENELKIKESATKLKELNTSKDLLFSIISHDLRTPFNQFIGGTELLLTKLEEYDKNMLRKFLTLLNKEAVRSYRLLENLLQWSKTQRGLIKFDPRPIDLFEFVDELMKFYESMAEEKGIELNVKIPKSLHVYADKEMLSTILRNLVSNALKFTDKGGEVEVSVIEKNDMENMFSEYLEVSVSDTGIGIKEENISSIFSIDENKSNSYKESATGLGLLLCKDFVERHNGEIWVESEYGKGSTFYFTIK